MLIEDESAQEQPTAKRPTKYPNYLSATKTSHIKSSISLSSAQSTQKLAAQDQKRLNSILLDESPSEEGGESYGADVNYNDDMMFDFVSNN